MELKQISSATAKEFLLPKHYSGRTPTISVAFGWFDEDELKAVCTFGKPASNNLCVGVCGKEYSDRVYELNRLCRTEDLDRPLSQFVGGCLRELKQNDWIIVSYSDTAMNHHGYIYQACNFLYTGATKQRTDMYVSNGKHSRHYSPEQQVGLRKVRSSKHRYIYFCTSNKKLKKEWQDHLLLPIEKYPKGDNSNYVLGEYLEDKLVVTEKCSKWLDNLLNEEV